MRSRIVRRSIFLVALAAQALAPLLAVADLGSPAQMGVARYDNTDHWSVWTSSYETQSLLENFYAGHWEDHGNGGSGIGAKGVTATGWSTGAFRDFESTFFIGIDGKLYEHRIGPGVHSWTKVPNGPPKGPPGQYETLTGYVAAAMNKSAAGTLNVLCFVTTLEKHLFAYKIPAAGGAGTWVGPLRTGAAELASETQPIAASHSPDMRQTRVFYVRTDLVPTDQLATARWDGGAAWAYTVIGRPGPGIAAYGTVAAVQDNLSGTGDFRGYVFFTQKEVTSNLVHYARTVAQDSDAFAWGSLQLPDGHQAQNTNFALAAGARPSNAGGPRGIDVFVLSTESPPRLYMSYEISAAALTNPMWFLYEDPETVGRDGGLAATPTGDPSKDWSYVFYRGWQKASDPTIRRRLYSRLGDPYLNPSLGWLWRNHQSATPVQAIVKTATAGAGYGESSSAFYGGRGITVATRSPGTGSACDLPTIDMMWSDSAGDSWNAPVPVGNPDGFAYEADPTTDFTDGDATGGVPTAYIVALDINHQPDGLGTCGGGPVCGNSGGDSNGNIYSTTEGAAPVFVAQLVEPGPRPGDPVGTNWTRVEHPSMAIQRRASLPDILHVAWLAWSNGGLGVREIGYQTLTEGGALTPSGAQILIDETGGGLTTPSKVGAPLLTVGQSGAVTIAWYSDTTDCDGDGVGDDSDYYVCRISVDGFGNASCLGGAQSLCLIRPDLAPLMTAIDTQNGLRDTVERGQGASFRASQTSPNLVYYTYNASETDAGDDPGDLDDLQEKDVYFSVLNFDPSTQIWGASTRVAVHPFIDDGADQFMPSVAVQGWPVAVGVSDLISVVYYNRSQSCPGYSLAPGTFNRCYTIRHAVSLDGGLTFSPVGGPMGAGAEKMSDVDLLTAHCPSSTGRWMGDYHDTTGDWLHVQQNACEAPIGSDEFTGDLTNLWASTGYVWYWP